MYASLHVNVRRNDELHESRSIEVTPGRKPDVAHKPTRAHQQALGIGNLGASEESNINVGFENIDVGEGRVGNARRRMSIMQQFSYVPSASTHGLKPALSDCSQFTRMPIQPGLNAWISLNRARES
jgi:hypothetical protein